MTLKNTIKNKFLSQILVIDTESTGVDPKTAEICEIATGIFSNNQLKITDKLFGTREPIPFSASCKNNISRTMLLGKKRFHEHIEEEKSPLISFGFDDSKINYFVAHNTKYDKPILEHNIREKNSDFYKKFSEKSWICTYRLAKHLYPIEDQIPDWSYAQNYLRYALGIEMEVDTHRAGDDVRVCFTLLNIFCDKILDNFEEDELSNDIDLGQILSDISETPVSYSVMPIGKHKGEKLTDIPMSYYEWLLKSSEILNENHSNFDSDLAYNVVNELNRRA